MNTYSLVIGAFDWGCAVTRIILYTKEKYSTKDFCLQEILEECDLSSAPEYLNKVVTHPLEINEVTFEEGKVIFDLVVKPFKANPIVFNQKSYFNTWSNPYRIQFFYQNEEIEAEEDCAKRVSTADCFVLEAVKTEKVTYQTALYVPEKKTETLVVWLHGMGEGGTKNTNPYVTVLANKVTALTGLEFQTKVPSIVLAVQCPTFWMDDKGNMSRSELQLDQAKGISYYSESLMEVIKETQKRFNIQKTIVAGCSNGGYMTMVLALNYADYFDGFVPICEPYPDRILGEKEIAHLAKLPLYFIYSKDDKVVDPKKCAIPTVERLEKANGNVVASVSEAVLDTSGKFNDLAGNPVRYLGHWSWVYFFNNISFGVIKPFDWIKEIVEK